MTSAFPQTVRFLTSQVPAATARRGNTVMHAIGARSDAVYLTPVVDALRTVGVPQSVVCLAQTTALDAPVIDDDGLPNTEMLVEGHGSSAVQRTALALAEAERTLVEQTPALLVLAGDANTTLAFGLAASKLGVPIARVGGGHRCGDFSLSEEINRMLGDRLAEVVFVDSQEAIDALEGEGLTGPCVRHVGNTAVDMVRRWESTAQHVAAHRRLGLPREEYVLVTLHRPENVADDDRVARIAEALVILGRSVPTVMPLHPATRDAMARTGDLELLQRSGVQLTGPLGYLDFLSLEQSAGAILTDSGGVQEEASALGVRCFTLRRSTDRTITLSHGTNVLLGDDPDEIPTVRPETRGHAAMVPLWDGHAAGRIGAVIAERVQAVAA